MPLQLGSASSNHLSNNGSGKGPQKHGVDSKLEGVSFWLYTGFEHRSKLVVSIYCSSSSSLSSLFLTFEKNGVAALGPAVPFRLFHTADSCPRHGSPSDGMVDHH